MEDLNGIFEARRSSPAATGGGNTFLIGDADGVLAVPGGTRSVTGWTGEVTINALGGDDLVVVATRDSPTPPARRCTSTAAPAPTASSCDGTASARTSPSAATAPAAATRSPRPSGRPTKRTTSTVIDHGGLEDVLIRTYDGGDRILVRRIDVVHTIDTGAGDDASPSGR